MPACVVSMWSELFQALGVVLVALWLSVLAMLTGSLALHLHRAWRWRRRLREMLRRR